MFAGRVRRVARVVVSIRRCLHPSWWAYLLLGPASRGDYFAPVVHLNDEFERASETDLAGFKVETDTVAYRYAVRRSDIPNERE